MLREKFKDSLLKFQSHSNSAGDKKGRKGEAIREEESFQQTKYRLLHQNSSNSKGEIYQIYQTKEYFEFNAQLFLWRYRLFQSIPHNRDTSHLRVIYSEIKLKSRWLHQSRGHYL